MAQTVVSSHGVTVGCCPFQCSWIWASYHWPPLSLLPDHDNHVALCLALCAGAVRLGLLSSWALCVCWAPDREAAGEVGCPLWMNGLAAETVWGQHLGAPDAVFPYIDKKQPHCQYYHCSHLKPKTEFGVDVICAPLFAVSIAIRMSVLGVFSVLMAPS